MPYAAAAFFFNRYCFDEAFLEYGRTGKFLELPLKKYRNHNVKGNFDTDSDHPVVILEVDSIHHNLPRVATRLVQEMFVVNKAYGEVYNILETQGRNELRKLAVHFFIKLGSIPRHPPKIEAINSRRTAA